jgi:hypothetical protein
MQQDAPAGKWPTNKWWAATITAIGGFLVTWVSTGHWTRELSGAAITIATQRIVAYLVPNDATKGGIPPKRALRRRPAT